MEINVTKSRVMMDDIMQRYATLVSPLPSCLRALALKFLVESDEEAMGDLRQRLEVIAVEQIALSSHGKPEVKRDLRVKSNNNIAIPLGEYISPVKVLPPKAPLPAYDNVQKVADYALWTKTCGQRITTPSFDELPDATERQEHLN